MHSNGLWYEKKESNSSHTPLKNPRSIAKAHTHLNKHTKEEQRVKRNLALLFIFARKAHDPWHIDKWVIRCRHHRKLVFICDSHGIYSFTFFSFGKFWNEAFLMGKICEQMEKEPFEINEFYAAKIFARIFSPSCSWNCIHRRFEEIFLEKNFSHRHLRWLQNQFNGVLISCCKLNFRSFLLIKNNTGD